MHQKLPTLQAALKLLRDGQPQEAKKIVLSLMDSLDSESELFSAAGLANELNEWETALLLYQRIINHPVTKKTFLAYHALGNSYRTLGALQDAIFHYEKALNLNPNYLPTYLRLGNLYRVVKSNRAGIEMYRAGLKTRLDAPLHSRILLAMHYIADFSPEEMADEHRLWGCLYCPETAYDNKKHNLNIERKIRIGYVSGDMRLHSVSYFLIPLLRSQNREWFESYCYANSPITDNITNNIKQLSDGFRNISALSDKEACDLIRRDEIDILFDLSGHTPRNRLSLFALRPAPLQITYIGYPDTTGMAAMDYRIVDRLTDPGEGAEKLLVEKPLYLPGCFLCFSSLDKEGIAAASLPPSLENKQGITFGSFSEYVKITDQVLGAWATIISNVAGSKLLLKSKEFGHEHARRRVQDFFSDRGIDLQRLVFQARTPSREAHLQLYDTIDIALDTFPYNGTVTTFQALSMGVPVVTIIGDRHVSRVSYSILSHMGCRELAGKSIEEYITIATRLASLPSKLLEYKRHLRYLMNSTVSAEKPFMKEFEEKIRTIWIHSQKELKKKNDDQILTIGAVGDVILARRMEHIYQSKGLFSLLGPILNILSENDLNLCNLETVICDSSEFYPKKESKPYYFRCSSFLANLLKRVPFHVVVHGNNHAMDFGEKGLRFHKEQLRKIDITCCGSGLSRLEATRPAYVLLGNITVAIISFSCVNPKTIGATDSNPGVFLIDDPTLIVETLSPIIVEAKKNSNLIIISPHWNENWESKPSPTIRQQARGLIDLGCDAILGHSAHLLQGVEIYKGKPIVYDMGTFVVDNVSGHPELKYSALFNLQVDIKKGIIGLQVLPLELKPGSTIIRADGCTYSWIKNKILSLEDNGIDSSHFSDCGDTLRFIFVPDKAEIFSVTQPVASERLYPLMKPDLYGYKPDAVLDKIPSWCRDENSVLLGGKIELFGVKSPAAFKVGAGFLFEAIFRCNALVDGNYEIHLQGRCEKYGSEFNDFHPCSDGVYNPAKWEIGEIISDKTCVRPNRRLKPGKYQLYLGIKDVESGQYLRDQSGQKVTKIEGSVIYAIPEGITKKASGVDWDGCLKEELISQFEEHFYDHPEWYLLSWIRSHIISEPYLEPHFALSGFAVKHHFNPKESMVYISLFQDKKSPRIRWGCKRPTLQKAITRSLEKIIADHCYVGLDLSGKRSLTLELEMIGKNKSVYCSTECFPQSLV